MRKFKFAYIKGQPDMISIITVGCMLNIGSNSVEFLLHNYLQLMTSKCYCYHIF